MKRGGGQEEVNNNHIYRSNFKNWLLTYLSEFMFTIFGVCWPVGYLIIPVWLLCIFLWSRADRPVTNFSMAVLINVHTSWTLIRYIQIWSSFFCNCASTFFKGTYSSFTLKVIFLLLLMSNFISVAELNLFILCGTCDGIDEVSGYFDRLLVFLPLRYSLWLFH